MLSSRICLAVAYAYNSIYKKTIKKHLFFIVIMHQQFIPMKI